MYNNYREPKGSFSHSLKDADIHRAATLHPVKNSSYQYRIHQYFMSRSSIQQRNKLNKLQREINFMNEFLQDRDEFYSPSRFGLQPSLMKTIPKFRNEVLDWEYLSKTVLSTFKHSNPRRGMEVDIKQGLSDVVMQVMEMINHNTRQKGRTIDFKEILYGYRRTNPLHGADYILDMLLVYRKFKGKRKMTVPVRRHAYLQQIFLELEFIEDYRLELSKPKSFFATTPYIGILDAIQHKFGLYSEKLADEEPVIDVKNVRVNFILPLCGRYKTFLQFIHNFEDACLKKNENVSLLVMLFHSEEDDRTEDTITNVRALQDKYPQQELKVFPIQGTFSRGIALQKGSSMLAANQLLFFIDVDMYIQSDSLWRIRLNTIQDKQVYYPVVFSQYDPQLICEKETESDSCPPRTTPFSFDSNNGYWRLFGYGIAAMYNSDFQNIGGFDQDIKGWGKEDVNLMEKYILSNFTVFRSVDVGLVHIFHSILCDPSLDPAQYQMCLGSKAASYASTEKLASIVYKTSEIFNRNEMSKSAHQESVNFQEAGDS